MKTLALAVALGAIAGAAAAQPRGFDVEKTSRLFQSHEERAFRFYERKDWDRAIAAFERQMAIFPGSPRPHYNIACCYALQGNAHRAAVWLRLAVAAGWRDLEHLEADADFEKVRTRRPFVDAVEDLEELLRTDPSPLPRTVAPKDAPAFPSAAALLNHYRREERRILRYSTLLEEEQMRRKLFPLWDRKRASLRHYLASDGDAKDAHFVAYGLVEASLAYQGRASQAGARDVRLRREAASLVRKSALAFEQGWPESFLLPLVQLLAIQADEGTGITPEPERREQLRRLIDDHGGTTLAARALVELCRLQAESGDLRSLRRDYAALKTRWGAETEVASWMGLRLVKARLLVEGIPGLQVKTRNGGTFELHDPGRQAAILVFLRTRTKEGEALLRRVQPLLQKHQERGAEGLVFVEPPRSPESEEAANAWLAEHAKGFATTTEGLEINMATAGLERPCILVVDGLGRVHAIQPDDAELGRKLARLLPE